MGIVLWAAAGIVAFLVARIVPVGRGRAWIAELLVALGASLLLGALATALDFGGWRELDWRAGVFALLGALAAVGFVRGATMSR